MIMILAVIVAVCFLVRVFSLRVTCFPLVLATTRPEENGREQSHDRVSVIQSLHFPSFAWEHSISGRGKPDSNSISEAAWRACFLVSRSPSIASRYCFCSST